jgi:hypothetical protein
VGITLGRASFLSVFPAFAVGRRLKKDFTARCTNRSRLLTRADSLKHARINQLGKCKICSSQALKVAAHTAKCDNCGVLLYYPYPVADHPLLARGGRKPWPRRQALTWYSESSFYNHTNFNNMIRFAMDDSCKAKPLSVLDYGGGGGQFALVCKSHFPQADVFIT